MIVMGRQVHSTWSVNSWFMIIWFRLGVWRYLFIVLNFLYTLILFRLFIVIALENIIIKSNCESTGLHFHLNNSIHAFHSESKPQSILKVPIPK